MFLVHDGWNCKFLRGSEIRKLVSKPSTNRWTKLFVKRFGFHRGIQVDYFCHFIFSTLVSRSVCKRLKELSLKPVNLGPTSLSLLPTVEGFCFGSLGGVQKRRLKGNWWQDYFMKSISWTRANTRKTSNTILFNNDDWPFRPFAPFRIVF